MDSGRGTPRSAARLPGSRSEARGQEALILRRLLLVLLALTIAVGLGCSSGGGGGGTPTPKVININKDGGRIRLIVQPSLPRRTHVKSELWSAVSPDTSSSFILGDGHCVTFGLSTTGNPVFTDGDAGSALTFTYGGSVFSAPKLATNGTITYNAAYGGASPQGVSWTVSAAGGSFIPAGLIGSIRVPPALTGVSQITPVAGQEAIVTWNPVGADAAIVDVTDNVTGVGGECYPPDVGTFTIPAGVTTTAGNNASVLVTVLNADQVTINGRDVGLRGISRE